MKTSALERLLKENLRAAVQRELERGLPSLEGKLVEHVGSTVKFIAARVAFVIDEKVREASEAAERVWQQQEHQRQQAEERQQERQRHEEQQPLQEWQRRQERQQELSRREAEGPGLEGALQSIYSDFTEALKNDPPRPNLLGEVLGAIERELLEVALRENGRAFARTARALGIPSTTLKYRCRKLGLRSQGSGGPRQAKEQEPAPPTRRERRPRVIARPVERLAPRARKVTDRASLGERATFRINEEEHAFLSLEARRLDRTVGDLIRECIREERERR